VPLTDFLTSKKCLVIYRGLKNSNIEQEKFLKDIISKLLQEPEAKKKTKNYYVTYINPQKESDKREKCKRCGKLTM